MKQAGLSLVAKRGVDLLVAASVLAAAAPVLVGAAAAIRLTMGGPVFFRQTRPGYRGALFEIVKLRTMQVDDPSHPRSDAERLTAVGRFLRSSSIDELPQLWNVLRGEMSLVGPRPLLVEYLPLYTSEQARRHEVLPGLTGWAQINGRNALSHEQRFALDVWYVDNWSFWLDLQILARTLLRALRRQGVAADGHATMPKFVGAQTRAVAA